MTPPLHLTAVLNHGDSLRQWDSAGLFDRQMALFREFQARGMRLSLLTHGGRDDLDYRSRLPGTRILCNWIGLPAKTYARHAHQVHAARLLQSDIVQTIDPDALIVALRVAWAWQIPLSFHSGYMISELFRKTHPDAHRTIKHLEDTEVRGLNTAALTIVPTRDIADKMVRLAPSAADNVTVIPNFVDTDLFRPLPEEKRYDLVYVGRFASVKNLHALLEAVDQSGRTIAMIGGPLPLEVGTEYDQTVKLKARFGDLDGRIHWLGRLKNEELPTYINRGRVYILCSLSEGTARSMLEAMACGMPCIGTNISGLRSIITHAVNGYLCNIDAGSIAAAIQSVLAQPDLMRRLGENARQYAVENYSLPMLAQREYELLLDVARRHPVGGTAKRAAHYLFRRR